MTHHHEFGPEFKIRFFWPVLIELLRAVGNVFYVATQLPFAALWDICETCRIPLGPLGPFVFEMAIGIRGHRVDDQPDDPE